MLSVLNNISSIYAQNNLNSTQANLSSVLQQLSSGSRINSGADDAAVSRWLTVSRQTLPNWRSLHRTRTRVSVFCRQRMAHCPR